MNRDKFKRLMAFLNRLEPAKIDYTLIQSRDDALMVLVCAPSQYWEIEFLASGEIEVERYRSTGHIDDESVLHELLDLWADPVEVEAVSTNSKHSAEPQVAHANGASSP
jgi:hypothetical protein